MPSVDDVYNQLVQANTNLSSLINAVNNVTSAVNKATTAINAVHSAVDQVNGTLNTGFGELVTIGNYTNQALYQNDQQNVTIICALEHISKNTCALLNQSAVQTTLQTAMAIDIDGLENMFATANPAAALELERRAALKAQVEECCPPTPPTPPCDYKPCPAPKQIGPPPEVRAPSPTR
jgi:ABC-type transporter Mla subunit MlaD